MKLALFNGSPRGVKSNTKILLDHFQMGFEEKGGTIESCDYLIKQKELDRQVERFRKAQTIFLAFPLYADSVPGIVKNFIEAVGSFNGEGKSILFLVQSGFPEAVQSQGVKNYLELLSKRWKMNCLGVIVKPGVEGIQIMPSSMTKKLFHRMTLLGRQVAENGYPDQGLLDQLAKPYKFSPMKILVYRLMSLTGLTNFYWNHNLKKHHAYQKRFDAPYLSNEN